MMVDGKWTSSAHSSNTWSEPTSYGTLTTSGNFQNHARSDDGAVAGGRGICPPNWHVPTDMEWGDLLNEMETGTKNHNTSTDWIGTNAGMRAKSKCMCSTSGYCDTDTDVTSWYGGGTVGTDVFGFHVLPSGLRDNNGSHFNFRGLQSLFWSSSASSGTYASYRSFSSSVATVNRSDSYRSFGFAVRCIRDEEVLAPPPTTLCTQCCYNGSEWVDCYVTTNAYTFDNSSSSTTVSWLGGKTTYYSGARSDKDGRANTDAITGSTGTSAAPICQDLGTGWYLPAYEELVNMSDGANSSYSPMNGLGGAHLLRGKNAQYWSSTEAFVATGRLTSVSEAHKTMAVAVNEAGTPGRGTKGGQAYLHCAVRE
jgi:uncharacterized protein (TIGR02145 family)